MSFEPRDYLSHIRAEADYLIRQSEGLAGRGTTKVVETQTEER